MSDREIPRIISVDDHVVEPPDVWQKRLPAKYRDVGPHVVMAPAGSPILDGGTYREAPGTDGPDVAWWFYEDQQYSVKRLIAAAGYPADEIGFDGITFEQMRPGCWQPQARIEDMTKIADLSAAVGLLRRQSAHAKARQHGSFLHAPGTLSFRKSEWWQTQSMSVWGTRSLCRSVSL